MRYVFIVNPHAGGHKGFEMLNLKVESYFANSHHTYKVYETQYPKHATEIVRKELERGEKIRFYGVGGDGTLLEVVRGAAGSKLAEVGIFPIGSGNDYIRTYGTRSDFLNFDNQINGKAIEVDLISTLGGIAANICSVGLDAKVAYEMIHFKTLPGVNGSLAYDLSLAKCLCSKLGEELTAKITTENGEETFKGTFLFALAASGKWYGGGYLGAPKAVTNDGLLDFILIKKPPLYRIPNLVNKYKKGLHLESSDFKDLLIYRRGTEIELISPHTMICNRDGECDKVEKENFKLNKGGLKFILPLGLVYSENQMETDRLILRNWCDGDAKDYYEFTSDSLVMPLAGSRTVGSLEAARVDVHKYSLDKERFAIVLKENGKVIGSIKYQDDIRRFRVNSKSIGYELNRNYWGKGYMTEALTAMVKNAFTTMGIDVLSIGHFAGNEKSKRVIEKCGFTYEGTIRKGFKRYDEEIFDDVAYSMTREEFNNKAYK